VKTEPLIRQARKAYLQTEVAAVADLLEREAYWKRRHTIATNKLAAFRKLINSKAMELAEATLKKQSL